MSWFTELPGTFGITRLAEAFTLDAGRHTGGVLGEVAAWRDGSMSEQVAAAGQDCATLLGSALPGEQIAILWSGATGGLDRRGVDGRDWLTQVSAALAARPTLPVQLPDGAAEARAIRQAIQALGPALDGQITESLVPLAGPVTPVLGRCADVSPELAFRFLLATALRYWLPLPAAEYARLVAVADRLAYSPSLVESLGFLSR